MNQTATIIQEDEIPPLQNCKKLKHQDPLDDSIFTKRLGKSLVGLALHVPNYYNVYKHMRKIIYTHAGTVELLLSSLIEPDKAKRCVRPVDATFLDALIRKFERDPSAPGIPPMAVLCTSVVPMLTWQTSTLRGRTGINAD